MHRVDYNYVVGSLSSNRIMVRVVTDGHSRDGVVVGRQLKLGRMQSADLQRLSLPASLKSKLKPYLGKVGAEAQAAYRWQRLRLSANDRAAILRLQSKDRMARMAARYMSAVDNQNRRSFGSLPAKAQTALATLELASSRSLDQAMPQVWHAATQQDWSGLAQLVKRARLPQGGQRVSRLLQAIA